MNVTLADAVAICGALAQNGVPFWLDGDWCIDALLGRQTRDHADVDLAIERSEEARALSVLCVLGFGRSDGGEAWNYLLADATGRRIDVHVFGFDQSGAHEYGVAYPRETLSGHARLGDIEVNCIDPHWMLRFKTAYPPAENDRLDVQRLCEALGVEVPPTHR